MPAGSRFALFLIAATLLAITPGPGILYVLARSISGGRREGVLSSYGTFLGGLVHVAAAAFGLSAILATSARLFDVVKYAGALYLVYLGISMIRNRDGGAPPEDLSRTRNNPFVQGIVTEVLNPKTALFFLSFIPQFVSIKAGNIAAQFILLGAISVTFNTSVDLVVAWFAGPLGEKLKKSVLFRRRQRVASGVGMIGLGVYLATSDSRHR